MSDNASGVKVPSVIAEKSVTTPVFAKSPKIRIVGCGGCGIRLAGLISKVLGENKNISVSVVDTSEADNAYVEGVQVITLGDMGSGGYRRENANAIASAISTKVVPSLGLSDELVVLVFALSGGSGSVIGPHMIKALAPYSTGMVAATVVDTSTALWTQNSVGTLKTIEKFAVDAGVYLPMMMFSNDIKGNRAATEDVLKQIHLLSEVLTTPAGSIDQNDRRHWINPRKTLGLPAGVYTLEVLVSGKQISDTQIVDVPAQYDSVLNFIPEGKEIEDYPELRVQMLAGKVGYLPNNSATLSGRTYVPGDNFKKFVTEVDSHLKLEKAHTSRIREAVIVSAKDESDETGMIY